MREAGEQIVDKVGFQLLLFFRAQIEVPRFYLINLINILLTKRN
jgi:hypothetical protein